MRMLTNLQRTGVAAHVMCMAALATGGNARAEPVVTQPTGINLGLTSYYDGFGRAAPGLVYMGYWQYARFDAINDANGDAIGAFRDPEVEVYLWLNQFVYQFDRKVLGARPGVTLILPYTTFSSSFDSAGVALRDNGSGIGDLTIGGVLQYDPVVGSRGWPVFSHRFELDVILPTGKYDERADINQGAGFYSLNPSWAGSMLFPPWLELSWRAHYLYNFKNEQPAASDPTALFGVRDTQAGDAAWINFAASYSFTPKFHAGLNGYYFQQFGEDEVNGRIQQNSKERVLAFGPGLRWDRTEADKLLLNVYLHTAVENRPEGAAIVNFHWVHLF